MFDLFSGPYIMAGATSTRNSCGSGRGAHGLHACDNYSAKSEREGSDRVSQRPQGDSSPTWWPEFMHSFVTTRRLRPQSTPMATATYVQFTREDRGQTTCAQGPAHTITALHQRQLTSASILQQAEREP